MLADRLREAGSPLGVSSVDPGTVATQILYNVSSWHQILAFDAAGGHASCVCPGMVVEDKPPGSV